MIPQEIKDRMKRVNVAATLYADRYSGHEMRFERDAAHHAYIAGYTAALKSSPVNPKSEGWIAVSERLPDGWAMGGDTVLVHLNNGRVKIGHIHGDDWDTDSRMSGVTHWMPLPSAPGEPSSLPVNPLLSPLKEAIEALRMSADTIYYYAITEHLNTGKGWSKAKDLAKQHSAYLACMEVINKSSKLINE